MLMCQGAVAEEDIGPEPQHAPGQILVGDVEHLGVVVGVGENDTTTRPHDPDKFVDRDEGIGEVLQGAIGPCPIEGVVGKRQPMGVPDGASGEAARSHGSSHGQRAIHGGHADIVFISHEGRACTGAGTDLDVSTAGCWMEQFADPLLVCLIEGFCGEAVEYADPRVRV